MRSLMLALAAILLTSPAIAADHQVLMLNYGKDGGMVFEPAYVKAAPGDTVTFVPQNSSHYVESFALPDGVAPWKSRLDQEFTVTLAEEGVYLYFCPPHLMMAMIGVIQVGAPVNLAAVKDRSARLRSKLVMKKERLDDYLAMVTE